MAAALDLIDPQTLGVTIQLHLDDVNDFKTNRKGKNRENDVTDEDLAMETWQAEVQAFAQQASDRALCESIARAVAQDADLIGVAVQEDIQAAEDRNMALRMSGRRAAASASRASTPALPSLDNELEAKLCGLNSPFTQNDSKIKPAPRVTAESLSTAADRFTQKFRPGGSRSGPTCTACGDGLYPEFTFHAPCNHDYCNECIRGLITASMADESLFPPRCCNQHLPLLDENIEPFEFISAELYTQFYKKKEEFETVDRTYCHVATCSRFLSSKADIHADIGTCPDCKSLTCTICKGSTHKGACPKDAAALEVLRTARENGWQKCRGCKRLIELDTGCNHITCICGMEFCYVCGLKWKNCKCPQWSEERLYARAAAVVDRDENVNEADRVAMIRRERENLIQNHECTHTEWKSRQGRRHCEQCHDFLPLYFYECQQCHIMVCANCRFNRL